MKIPALFAALVALGCSSTHRTESTSAAPDARVDERALDGGPLDASAHPNASHSPDAAVVVEDRDAGLLMADAAVEDDAALDASAGLCTGEPAQATAALGSAQSPLELALAALPFEGAIDWRGRAFLRITGVTPGTRYAVSASAASELVLTAFNDDMTFGQAACASGAEGSYGTARVCFVTATRDSIDVAIDAVHRSATFELSVRPAFHAEGTIAAPVQIALADLPYALETTSEEPSLYEITGLVSAEPYVVALRDAQSIVSLRVFEGSTFEGTPDQQQSSSPRAIGTPEGTSLFLAVRALGAGTTAQLTVEPATRTSEGSAAAPIQIPAGALPYRGEVGWGYSVKPLPPPQNAGADSFYAITGLAQGAYIVSIGGVVEPVRLYLYQDDSSFSYADSLGWTYASEGVTGQVERRIAGSVLYLKVRNEGGGGTPFTLGLEPAALTSVGTEAAPVEVGYAELPLNSEVEPGVDSYYAITGLTPGQTYRADVTGVTAAPVGVSLYSDLSGDFTGLTCELQVQTNSAGPTCNIVASGSTIHVRARVFGHTANSMLGSVFALSLEPTTEQPLGTPEEPVVVECPSGTYSSRLGTNGLSYYEITGLEPSVAYLVEVDPARDYASIDVFSGGMSDPFYAPDPCTNHGDARAFPARCVATSATGSLFVRVTGYAWGEPLEISVRRALSGSEGTKSAPVMLALAEPYRGHVSGASPSFYAFTGVTPGTAYIARVAPVEEKVAVTLIAGGGFDNAFVVGTPQVTAGQPLEQVFVATSTTAYLIAALPVGSDGLSDVEVELIEAPHQSEGVLEPLPLTLAELPRAGSVDGARVSRYVLTALTPGEPYLATLSNVSAQQVTLDVNEADNPSLDKSCPFDAQAASVHRCTFTPQGDTVTIEVRLTGGTSSSFDMDVSPEP